MSESRNVLAEPWRPWTAIDDSGDADYYIRYLDAIREVGEPLKAEALSLLELRPGEAVLDIGCGTGDDTAAMADAVGESGRAVGVDSAAAMVVEARSRFGQRRANLRFEQARGESLPFGDATFDACYIERTLQHVAVPAEVVAEVHRVLRPGGRVVALEPDWGLSASDYLDDEELEARLEPHRMALLRSFVPSAYIGRRLFRILGRYGFTDRRVELRGMIADMATPMLAQPVLAQRARLIAERMRAMGGVSESDLQTLVRRAESAEAADDYFAVTGMFLVTARKADT